MGFNQIVPVILLTILSWEAFKFIVKAVRFYITYLTIERVEEDEDARDGKS